MTEQTPVPVVYTLTDMTGQRKNRDRGVMYLGAEVNVYHRNMMLLGSPFIFLAVAVTATFAGYYSVLFGIAVAIAWYWLIVRRPSEGLGTNAWTAHQHKRASLAGRHLQSGIPLSPALRERFQVIPSSVQVNDEPAPEAVLAVDRSAWTAAPSPRSHVATTTSRDAWADDTPASPDDQETW